jgi:hypothetical protein
MHKALYALASVLVTALVISPFAFATGEGSPVKGGSRNPSPNPSLSYKSETQIISDNSTYGTRQSNKGTGGGAIYGCRAPVGGNACMRASNLVAGQAFSFESAGAQAGTITAAGGDNAKPFTTNATGVATGLNADRVDSMHASDIIAAARALSPHAQVAADGTLSNAAGVASSVAGNTSSSIPGNYTVVFSTDVSKCAITATESTINNAGAVAVQTQADGKTVFVRTRHGGDVGGGTPTDVAALPFNISAEC